MPNFQIGKILVYFRHFRQPSKRCSHRLHQKKHSTKPGKEQKGREERNKKTNHTHAVYTPKRSHCRCFQHHIASGERTHMLDAGQPRTDLSFCHLQFVYIYYVDMAGCPVQFHICLCYGDVLFVIRTIRTERKQPNRDVATGPRPFSFRRPHGFGYSWKMKCVCASAFPNA